MSLLPQQNGLPEMYPTGGMGGLLSGGNPLMNIGLGILANNYGNYGALGPALGRGAQQGMQQTQQWQQLQNQNKLSDLNVKKAQMELDQAAKAEQARQKALNALRGVGVFQGPYKDANEAVKAPNLDDALLELDPAAYIKRKTEKSDPIKLGKGERLIDPLTNKEIIGAAATQEDLPSSVQEYNFAKEQGFKGSFMDFELAKKRAGASNTTVSYGAPVAGVDASGNPIFFQPSKDGGAPSIISGVAPPKNTKAPTEIQAKAGTFHSQMVSASNELGALSREGYDPSRIGSQVETTIAGGATNPLAGQKSQRARQAQEQWAEAFLRVKTGAAATQGEVDRNVRTFFPTIGDSPEVIAQKARARAQAESDVASMAGGASQTQQAPRDRKSILQQYGIR
jgi:hypothetical protein